MKWGGCEGTKRRGGEREGGRERERERERDCTNTITMIMYTTVYNNRLPVLHTTKEPYYYTCTLCMHAHVHLAIPMMLYRSFFLYK